MPTPDGMRLDEAVEQIEDLQAKLIRAEDERDYFKQALQKIVEATRADWMGAEPGSVARKALEGMEARYGR